MNESHDLVEALTKWTRLISPEAGAFPGTLLRCSGRRDGRGLVVASKKPSKYELQALKEIHAWKNPEMTWMDQALKVINWPLDKAGDVVTSVPGVEWALDKTVGGLVSLLNDIAQWSVRPSAIVEEFQSDGHSRVRSLKGIRKLDLEQVDHTIGYLGAKYKSLALTEGAGAGATGAPGIPADIIALVAMNLRAAGEYSTYCGFNVSSQQERLFAMNILGLSSSPSDTSKHAALAQLLRISMDVARKSAWKDLEKHVFVQIIQRIAKALCIRLTKAKLAQLIPVTGAVIGGGFNAYFISKVTDASYYLYRERFLAEKYGAEVIEAVVKPAKSYQPDYEEA